MHRPSMTLAARAPVRPTLHHVDGGAQVEVGTEARGLQCLASAGELLVRLRLLGRFAGSGIAMASASFCAS